MVKLISLTGREAYCETEADAEVFVRMGYTRFSPYDQDAPGARHDLCSDREGVTMWEYNEPCTHPELHAATDGDPEPWVDNLSPSGRRYATEPTPRIPWTDVVYSPRPEFAHSN